VAQQPCRELCDVFKRRAFAIRPPFDVLSAAQNGCDAGAPPLPGLLLMHLGEDVVEYDDAKAAVRSKKGEKDNSIIYSAVNCAAHARKGMEAPSLEFMQWYSQAEEAEGPIDEYYRLRKHGDTIALGLRPTVWLECHHHPRAVHSCCKLHQKRHSANIQQWRHPPPL